MSIKLNDNFHPRAPKLIDNRAAVFESGKTRPYSSIEEALAMIPVFERSIGLSVLIGSESEFAEYWFNGLGTLAPKTSGGGGAVGGFEYIPITESNEIHLSPTSAIQKAILDRGDVFIDGMTRNAGDSGILILQQDDAGSRRYALKDRNFNKGNVVVRNSLPRAITTLHWYRDDQYCYWKLGDTVTGVFPTIKPVFRADDFSNTLELYHSLPKDELEYSENNGPWRPYVGPIYVGDVNRPAGYWRARTKPQPYRTNSPIEYSMPFTAGIKGFPYTFNFTLS